MRLDFPRRYVASICSNRDVVAEASGLTTVMKSPPSSAAMTSAGSRNCQTETPRRTRHHELAAPRHLREGHDTADEHDEGQRLLRHEGDVQRCHLENGLDRRRLVRPGGAAQQLDRVGNENGQHDEQEHERDALQVVPAPCKARGWMRDARAASPTRACPAQPPHCGHRGRGAAMAHQGPSPRRS